MNESKCIEKLLHERILIMTGLLSIQVMEMLVHINKRVKSLPGIKLPVQDLIEQYNDPNISPFVTVSNLMNMQVTIETCIARQ